MHLPAKQESVNTILEMVQHKQQNGGKAQAIIQRPKLKRTR
jgi:hypothetical protein